jgi:AAA family ATP:ADP antiporter
LPWGPTNLLLLSAAFLGWAVWCIHRLALWRMAAGAFPETAGIEGTGVAGGRGDKALGGSVLAGIRLIGRSPYLIGICLLMLLFTTLSTFLYFQQAQIVRDSFAEPSKRTAVFAAMDFSVNALTLFIQLFWTGRIVKQIGLDWSLALIPLLLAGGFLLLWLAPGLAVIAAVQVARRAGDYAIMRPGREMLYVVLTREEKYKAKNFIDTVVYRAGDAVSAWVYAGLQGIGLSAAGICLLAAPVSAVWAWICFRLGRRQEQMAAAEPPLTASDDFRRR